MLKSIFFLSKKKYVSRKDFCKEIRLGEGAVKTLVNHLKEYDLVLTIKSGTYLTEKGKKFAKEFLDAVPSQTYLKKCKTTNSKHNYAILLKEKFVLDLGNGMNQRDNAILYGASDSLTLIFKKGNFLFAGDEVVCFEEEPDTRDHLINALKPIEGDVLIITSSNDKFVAEISAINTALWTLGNNK